jgi:isoleucyl-tRNA synthetase
MEYKATLNLPKTSFPIKLDALVEAETTKEWFQHFMTQTPTVSSQDSQTFVLHDGPPFANGDIHLGHVINKTLKDVIVRRAAQLNMSVSFRAGWDCHGLPIENKVKESVVSSSDISELRLKCFAYANEWKKTQMSQFGSFGIRADWFDSYSTIDPSYEAEVAWVFAKLMELGLIERKLRPVHWSVQNRSALAEAEIEYLPVTVDSVYVKFRGLTRPYQFLVWTTTPWTLPANRAIAFNPKLQYSVVESMGAKYVLAAASVDRVFAGKEYKLLWNEAGSSFFSQAFSKEERYQNICEGLDCPILPADFVTDTAGTGLVHIAPGHGTDDYLLGKQFDLPVYCPVLADGKYDQTVHPESLRGVKVTEADEAILEFLKKLGVLFSVQSYVHDYPHDWRSHKPVISRATNQWFVALDKPFSDGSSLRARAISACEEVSFVPAYGKKRLLGMLRDRPDWCISRQRVWGIPIPVFYEEDKDRPVMLPKLSKYVAESFADNGSDCWQLMSPSQLTGRKFNFPVRKETDIFDVWFESGCSWTKLDVFPADVYLEGSDQHRGWFQHSLLLSLAITGKVPFKTLITHGFVVGPNGEKISKSDKNYVTAMQELAKYGADPLRLWVCSLDFTEDMRCSPQMLADFMPKYAKIRNTIRYLVSNLYDFDPRTHYSVGNGVGLNLMIRVKAGSLAKFCEESYVKYDFYRVVASVHDFCAVDISSFYGNAMKDSLYCDLPDGQSRREAQSTMHDLLILLMKLLDPIIPMTIEEVRNSYGKEKLVDRWDVMSEVTNLSDSVKKLHTSLMAMRDQALIALENMKTKMGLNKAMDAKVTYWVPASEIAVFESLGSDLEDLVGCGSSEVIGMGEYSALVEDMREKYKMCARSRKRRIDVGADSEYPDLCVRDAHVVRSLKERNINVEVGPSKT